MSPSSGPKMETACFSETLTSTYHHTRAETQKIIIIIIIIIFTAVKTSNLTQ
jgi:hypothetical protein